MIEEIRYEMERLNDIIAQLEEEKEMIEVQIQKTENLIDMKQNRKE